MQKYLRILSSLAVLFGLQGCGNEPPVKDILISQLTTEHRANPIGIDVKSPRLSWQLLANYNGAQQTAYQLQLALDEYFENIAWDSQKTQSHTLYDISPEGLTLKPQTRYFWRVKVWDGETVSDWSDTKWFETAFFDSATFNGKWIAKTVERQAKELPETLVRKAFTIPSKDILSARLYIAGLGLYQAEINGQRVSQDELKPAYTPYNKRVYYETYDVTPLLNSGHNNAIGIRLGRGNYAGFGDIDIEVAPWLGEPKVKAMLSVTFTDGSEAMWPTDESWTTADGPTITNSLKYGEQFDARSRQTGWSQAGFDDSQWQVTSIALPPAGRLVARNYEPIRVVASISPKEVSQTPAGSALYDFRSTQAGWAKVTVKGPAGASIKLVYGEKLNATGSVFDGTGGPFGGTALQQYEYILAGDAQGETYVPRYSYNGYRFVEIHKPDNVEIVSVEGQIVHNDIAVEGSFESSDPLLNRYHRAMVRSTLNNFHGIPTDTPMYEKRGWAADALLIVDSALRNTHSQNLWEKWMQDHQDNQTSDGGIAVIVPNQNPGGEQPDPFVGKTSDPIWSSSYVQVNFALFWLKGDKRIVQEQYPGMKAWMEKWIATLTETDFIFTGNTWGDHEPAHGAGTDNQIVASAFLIDSARKLALMASLLGYSDDSSRFTRFAENVIAGINRHFYSAQDGYYDFPYVGPFPDGPPPGMPVDLMPDWMKMSPEEVNQKQFQTDNVLPLAFGIVPTSKREALCQSLIEDVLNTHEKHITSGATVLKATLPVLTECGAPELAYQAAVNPTYPGWGYWFSTLNGSTADGGEEIVVDTHWEAWGDHARSHNHAFRGTIDDWLFEYVAGIKPTAYGYASLIVKPTFLSALDFARASLASPFGDIKSYWYRGDNNIISLEVSVPIGAKAEIWLPVTEKQQITAPADVTLLSQSKGYAIYQARSGLYQFTVYQ